MQHNWRPTLRKYIEERYIQHPQEEWYDFSLTLYTRAPFYAQAFALMLLVLGLQNIVQTGEAPFIYTKF